MFAALIPGELALYKSEQVKRAGQELISLGLPILDSNGVVRPDPARPSLWALGSASFNCKAAVSERPRVEALICSHPIVVSGGAQTGGRRG